MQVTLGHKWFKEDRENVENHERNGLSRSQRTDGNVKKERKLVNPAYYVEILKRLREAVCRESPKLWPSDWILHHDIAPAHRALSVKQFLAKNQVLKWNTHPLALIWLRMTFDCFSNTLCLERKKILKY